MRSMYMSLPRILGMSRQCEWSSAMSFWRMWGAFWSGFHSYVSDTGAVGRRAGWSNSGGLNLGRIDADFCNQMFLLQNFRVIQVLWTFETLNSKNCRPFDTLKFSLLKASIQISISRFNFSKVFAKRTQIPIFNVIAYPCFAKRFFM